MSRRRQQYSIDQLELTATGTLADKPRRRQPDTSRSARSKAATRTHALRALILSTIDGWSKNPAMGGATADEVADFTAATEHERHDVRRLMEIRRRTSDLSRQFKVIKDTGIRRTNAAGNAMIVWAPVETFEIRKAWSADAE